MNEHLEITKTPFNVGDIIFFKEQSLNKYNTRVHKATILHLFNTFDENNEYVGTKYFIKVEDPDGNGAHMTVNKIDVFETEKEAFAFFIDQFISIFGTAFIHCLNPNNQ